LGIFNKRPQKIVKNGLSFARAEHQVPPSLLHRFCYLLRRGIFSSPLHGCFSKMPGAKMRPARVGKSRIFPPAGP
jgi:hypothetical protein